MIASLLFMAKMYTTNMNYITLELVVKNYEPEYIEKEMMFIRAHHANTENEYLEVFVLSYTPISDYDQEQFIANNGYPIELYLIDELGKVIVTPEEIGWWDEGEDSDSLTDISIRQINDVIQMYDGLVDVQVEDDGEIIIVEGKAIMSYFTEEYEEDFDETLDDGLEPWED
jgi:hypothetical protein